MWLWKIENGTTIIRKINLLYFVGDYTIAYLTNSYVHLVYCELNMPMNSEEELITLVVHYQVCSEVHKKIASFPQASLQTRSWTTK